MMHDASAQQTMFKIKSMQHLLLVNAFEFCIFQLPKEGAFDFMHHSLRQSCDVKQY